MDKKKKPILYITHEDDKYGAAQSFLTLILAARRYGYEPIVITTRNNHYTEICDINKIINYVIDYKRCCCSVEYSRGKKIVMCCNYHVRNKFAIHKIESIIRKFDIQLIHVNSSVMDLGISLSKKCKVPLIWHIREFLDLDFNQTFYKKNQINLMNKSNANIIYISNAIKEHWQDKGITLSNKVIYNGLKVKQKDTIKKKVHAQETKVMFSGHITKEKGQWQLIEAVSKLNKADQQLLHIDFYGKGHPSYVNSLIGRVKEEKLQSIISFKGYDPNITDILHMYDIGVVASRAEGFGRVTVEYMQAGLCVIASDTGANKELIEDNHTGLIYEYGNISDLSKKLEYLIRNPNAICEMGLHAKEVALVRFSEDRYIRDCMEYYREVLNDY